MKTAYIESLTKLSLVRSMMRSRTKVFLKCEDGKFRQIVMLKDNADGTEVILADTPIEGHANA